MKLATTLLDVAGRHETDEALVDGPVGLDAAAVVRHAGVVSAGLAGLRVEPGERVAILLPNGCPTTRSTRRYWSRAWPKYISSQIASSLWVSTSSPARYREISRSPTNRR